MITGRPVHMPEHVPSDPRSDMRSAAAPASQHGRARTYRVRELVKA